MQAVAANAQAVRGRRRELGRLEPITPRGLAHTRILPGTRAAAERVGGTDSRLGRPVGDQDNPNDAAGTPGASISSLALQRRQVEVMVLVKATPQPSTKYGDTVCVAGALLGQGPVRWIRLYPIPFRYLESAAKFRKYQTVTVELRPTPGDRRPESAKVNLEQIVGDPWPTVGSTGRQSSSSWPVRRCASCWPASLRIRMRPRWEQFAREMWTGWTSRNTDPGHRSSSARCSPSRTRTPCSGAPKASRSFSSRPGSRCGFGGGAHRMRILD
jgi:hypothetical protein